MSSLFETGSRGDWSPLFDPPHYEFLNRSPRPSVERLRRFWEEWFQNYSSAFPSAVADLCGRFQSLDDDPHDRAALELLSFAIFSKALRGIEVHPSVPTKRTAPDFLVTCPDGGLLYAECVIAGEPKAKVSLDQLNRVIHNQIDQLQSGNFMLQIETIQRGTNAPSTRRLRSELQKWLQTLQHSEVLSPLSSSQELPEFTWEDGGWKLLFNAIPLQSGQTAEKAIGVVGPTVGVVATHTRLREVLAKKASKYGELTAPFLVIVSDSMEFPGDEDTIQEALFGDLVFLVNHRTRSVTSSLSPNGVWRGPKGARARRLSAVLYCTSFDSINFMQRSFVVYHHPSPYLPLKRRLFPFAKEFTIDPTNGKMVAQEPTTSLVEHLGLPPGWPHWDQDSISDEQFNC